MSRAASDLASSLAKAANPRVLMQSHPWATLGASTVAGFVATTLLVPSKEEQALKKLAAIERALNPPPPPPPPKADGKPESGEAGYKSGRQGITRAIMGEVIGALKPALVSLLTAGVTATAAKPSQSEMQAAAAAEDHNQSMGGTPGGY